MNGKWELERKHHFFVGRLNFCVFFFVLLVVCFTFSRQNNISQMEVVYADWFGNQHLIYGSTNVADINVYIYHVPKKASSGKERKTNLGTDNYREWRLRQQSVETRYTCTDPNVNWQGQTFSFFEAYEKNAEYVEYEQQWLCTFFIQFMCSFLKLLNLTRETFMWHYC